ncbi:hypothetical protein HanXRQr2_Chr02g0074451 [Helianthus annuus]|nr:hypothetical protein HanXRQr2_Chr02g0074451 [Helianthus annuus]
MKSYCTPYLQPYISPSHLLPPISTSPALILFLSTRYRQFHLILTPIQTIVPKPSRRSINPNHINHRTPSYLRRR